MKKLTLREARAKFNRNVKIYLKTSKVPLQVMERSSWIPWFEIKNDETGDPEATFDKLVDKFQKENCCEELGLIPNYYIKQTQS